MSYVRLAFSNALLDEKQTPVVKITNNGGTYQLNIIVGILPTADGPDKARNREAVIDKELFLKGEGNITFEKISDDEKTSTLTFLIKATVDTKIPGTGGFKAVDLKSVVK